MTSSLMKSNMISGKAQEVDRYSENFGPGNRAHASLYVSPCQEECLVSLIFGKHLIVLKIYKMMF